MMVDLNATESGLPDTQHVDTVPPARETAVSFTNVSHRFHDSVALNDISFQVERGEFCALVGPSGCGKTTCLNVLAGEVTADEGDVVVLGDSPRHGDQRIGYMFARDSLYPWRTASRNVTLGLENRGIPKKERERHAAELLDAVGLAANHDSYPSQLSHGMRQRVALARTFALGAELLLMDEPFAALDAQTRIMLEQHLTQLWERDRSTVLFVTHDLAEAIVLADRIVLFTAAPGRIKRVFDVPLPRPRSVTQLQGMPEFHELYEAIWTDLEDEFSRASH